MALSLMSNKRCLPRNHPRFYSTPIPLHTSTLSVVGVFLSVLQLKQLQLCRRMALIFLTKFETCFVTNIKLLTSPEFPFAINQLRMVNASIVSCILQDVIGTK